MSNHRPTPHSGPREDSRRRDYDYDEPRPRNGSSRSSTRSRPDENRGQASRTPGRPASDRPSSGRSPSGRPAAERPSSGRPSSNRPSAGRPPSGRPPSRGPTDRRRPVKRRRRSLLPLVFFLALLAVMALLLRSCLSSDEGPGAGSGSYQLSFSSSPLIIGETGEATLEGLPDDFSGDILWSSSATNIVTASGNGKTCSLVAKSKGNASIVAIVDGETFSNTIQVIEPGQVISELTLNQTTATILSGNTLQLTASVTKADQSEGGSISVTWASSNVSVARVTNDGLVTARDVGTAYITATLGNQTASCAVTVEKNPDGTQVTSQEGYEAEPEATGQNTSDTPAQETAATSPSTNTSSSVKVSRLALDQTFGFLSVGETLTLDAAVAPSGVSVTWSSSNPTVATVSPRGVVTAKNPGTALISATAGNLSASYDLTVSAADDGSGSTGTQGPSGDEQVYPEE